MSAIRNSIFGALFGIFALSLVPSSAFAAPLAEYGAWYQGSPPYYQPYYSPMYVYAYSPAQSSQNTYINYPQQNYSYGYPQQNSFGYGAPSYNYYPQYSYPQYNSYPSYGYNSGPYAYGYPTGETMPWLGGQICDFPDYGRASCGSNPRQYVYDHWTGTWY